MHILGVWLDHVHQLQWCARVQNLSVQGGALEKIAVLS